MSAADATPTPLAKHQAIRKAKATPMQERIEAIQKEFRGAPDTGDAFAHFLNVDAQQGAEPVDPEFLKTHRGKFGFENPCVDPGARERQDHPGASWLAAAPAA